MAICVESSTLLYMSASQKRVSTLLDCAKLKFFAIFFNLKDEIERKVSISKMPFKPADF
jgi:hypothetical protein